MRIWIRILLLIKVMKICDHWSTDSPRLHFEPPQVLNFDLDADPDPAFDFNVDPDPDTAFHSNAYGIRILLPKNGGDP
jgi:hypothetical protein